MLKKISLPVLVTVMCLLVSTIVGLVYLSQKRTTKKVAKNEPEVTRTDYRSVARKNLDWMDGQRNDEGWYTLARVCSFNEKTCDTIWDNKEGNKDGLITTWARFNYYQQTKDAKDLAIVKSDINKFYEKYPNGVDNALWICKVTYDMWKSGIFNEETNNKLKDICFKSSSNFLNVFSDGKDYEEKFFVESLRARQTSPVWKTWNGYTFLIRGLDSYFGLTSDLLSQYLWTKDESKLDLAKKYFDSGKKIIEGMGSEAGANNSCLLALSAIDLYEYGGKNEDVLNYAKENYLTFESGDVKKYRTAICGLMAKRLYEITDNNTFLDGLERNNKVMTQVLLDGDESYTKKTGTYGFFVSNKGGFSMPFKNIVENGLIVELIRN